MNETENIRVAERLFDGFNAHDLKQGEAFEAEDYRHEAPGAPGALDREQARAYLQGFIDAFPDVHLEVTHKIAQGDWVVFNWVGSGTHTGGLRTPTGEVIPPTGKKISVPGSTTYQFKNGKAIYNHTYWDMVTLLAQLGLMPGM